MTTFPEPSASALRYGERLAEGGLGVSEGLEHFLANLSAVDGPLNALLEVFPDAAGVRARDSDARLARGHERAACLCRSIRFVIGTRN